MKKRFLLLVVLLMLLLVSCNDDRSEAVITVDTICSEHTFGEWNVLKKPTTISEGLKQRMCTNCGFGETEKIPKNTFSYSLDESGDKVFEVEIPFDPHEFDQKQTVLESSGSIKVKIDETEKTITIEGEALPLGVDINDIRTDIEQTLKDNNIIVDSDFDFDVKIPGYENDQDLVPSPW